MVKLALEGAFAIDCAGLCAATGSTFLAAMRGDFFTTCFVICAIVGSVFAVITWTTSFVVPAVRLSPPNVAGANACARAPALEMTRTDVVVKAKQASRFPTEARLCRESQVKASFFFKKNRGGRSSPPSPHSIALPSEILIAGKIIGPKSGRRIEHLVAIH